MSSTSLQSSQPRRGQALLLAVVIMIFAALLSASFIAVVSVNLNQTARQTDKNRSIVAAKAGVDYITKQIAYSDDGDKWRNELENVPPAPGDADYSFYYTPMEVAQGWARTTPHPTDDLNGNGIRYPNAIDPEDERLALVRARALTGKLELVKSPDPRSVLGQASDVPTFLAQVERVPTNSGTEQSGMLKATVIGLSNEDPTAFTKSIAYFGGYKNAPLAQVMRTVGNWDFVNGGPIVAQANPTGTLDNGTNAADPKLAVTNAEGDFSKLGTPFPITLSDPRNGIVARSAVVTAAVGIFPNFTLTLAQPLPTAPQNTERVELAANFGAPADLNISNATPAVPVPISVNLSDTNKDLDSTATPGINQVDGARINGSFIFSGALSAARLRAIGNSFRQTPVLVPGTILASGVIAPDTATTSSANINIVGGTTPDKLKASDATGIFASANVGIQNQLVSDGWNLRAGKASTDGTRNIRDFHPPIIDSGAGVARYRNLTRSSKPYDDGNPMTPALPASASLYGSGRGIYIDNTKDFERIGAVPMTQSDLVKMWLSATGVTDSYTRVPTSIASVTSTTNSLEEQHLRGWISPDQFRARGVEIELTSDWDPSTAGDQPGVFITRDPRSDNSTVKPTAALGPDPDNVWKDPRTGSASPGLYRKGFPWPTNGVVFAEGNINIKGQALNAPRSLTVISMNNIYIEDSLSADADGDGNLTTGAPRKIFLGAKKNVVMNPTRVLARPDAQTVSKNTMNLGIAVGGNVSLDVYDIGDFRIGDLVETSTAIAGVDTVSGVGQVTAINATNQTLNVTITKAVSASILPASFVRTSSEKQSSITSPTPYGIISDAGDSIQRRFTVPMAPKAGDNLRLAFNQGADRVRGATVSTDNYDATTPKPTSGIILTNKRVLDTGGANFDSTATNYKRANKIIRVDNTVPTLAGSEKFPSAAPSFANKTEAENSGLSSSTVAAYLKQEMEAVTTNNDPITPVGWKYDIDVRAGCETMPFFYLAGIGNRYDYGVKPTLPVAPTGLVGWQANIDNSDIAANSYQIPLTTSIAFWLNNPNVPVLPATASTMTNEHWNGTTYDQTKAFGFDPNFIDSGIASEGEDVLTADQSFYQTAATADPVKSTLDSRFFGALPGGENWFTLRQNPLAPSLAANAAANLPDYRVLNMKLEDVSLTPSTPTISAIKPGHTFSVNAYVYAQTGSWFVIPGPTFEPRLHGDATQAYFDFDNDNAPAELGEYLDVAGDGYNAGDFPDFNRNGAIDDADRYAVARYLRYNYQINFTGAIAENQTVLVNDAGTTAKGAVASWMDKWSTIHFDSTQMPPVPLTTDRIHYVFDPTIATNGLEQDDPSTLNIDETDYGFRLPQNAEVSSVS